MLWLRLSFAYINGDVVRPSGSKTTMMSSVCPDVTCEANPSVEEFVTVRAFEFQRILLPIFVALFPSLSLLYGFVGLSLLEPGRSFPDQTSTCLDSLQAPPNMRALCQSRSGMF